MLGGLINFTDPSKNSYYFWFIIIIIAIILLIQLIIIILKKYLGKQNPHLTLSLLRALQDYPASSFEIRYQRDILSSRYLYAFVITRSAMWARVPYLYALFMIVHKFSFAEIGFLFLIFSIGRLILGPIYNKLAHKYGHKLFCHIYNISIIISLLLLIQGSRILAYIAIIIASGFSAGLMKSIFEAWLICESGRLFGNNNDSESFRRNIFLKSKIYDGLISIITCIICAFIYTYFGITSPFWISIFLSLVSFIYISFFWNENIFSILQEEQGNSRLLEVLLELKKVDILCIGLIEGLVMACLNIYIFSWTPILKQSTPGGMNVGFIYMAMALALVIGSKFYEILIVYLSFDYYTTITINLFLQGLFLFLVYYINGFFWRMIFLSLFNGMFGLYAPLKSSINSDILNERNKFTIMSLFSIPTNVYVIVIFLHLNYMNCFTLALISSIMCLIAFVIGLFLVIYLKISKKNEENPQHEGYNHLVQHDN